MSSIGSSRDAHNGGDGAWFQARERAAGDDGANAGVSDETIAEHRARYRARYMRDAEERARLHDASERARRWFLIRIALMCWLGTLIGFVPMAWALHTTNMHAARAAWGFGQVLGPTIVICVLFYGWVRWEREEW